MIKEAKNTDTREIIPYSLNIEKELLDKVKELAEREFRSINKQLVYLISRGVQLEEESQSPPAKVGGLE